MSYDKILPTDVMRHLIWWRYQDGVVLAERDADKMDYEKTVGDIARGQVEQVVAVWEVNPVEGTCFDVSEDVARDVRDLLHRRAYSLSDDQRDFIESHLGCRATDGMA